MALKAITLATAGAATVARNLRKLNLDIAVSITFRGGYLPSTTGNIGEYVSVATGENTGTIGGGGHRMLPVGGKGTIEGNDRPVILQDGGILCAQS